MKLRPGIYCAVVPYQGRLSCTACNKPAPPIVQLERRVVSLNLVGWSFAEKNYCLNGKEHLIREDCLRPINDPGLDVEDKGEKTKEKEAING